jgi:hypothetical protein
MFENFVTWEVLASFAGAVTMTAAITQAVKGSKPLAKISTRVVSFCIALVVLALSTYFTKCLTIDTMAILPFNAFIVSTSANGVFEGVVSFIDKKSTDTARFDDEE